MAATQAAQTPDAQAYKPAVGDRVMVGKNQATVRFVGPTQFACGEWIGCELDDAQGKNDGSVQGERYFECKAGYGIFVREGMLRKPGSKKKSISAGSVANGKAAAAAAESPEATELRVQLAEAAEEHDLELLRELIPRAESSGVPKAELENAQHVLDFQVNVQAKQLQTSSLLAELDDVREAVAKLADVVASVEARAAAVERAVLARSAAEAEGTKGETSPGVESLLFDTALMDNWIKDFGAQLQQRVWETLERDVEKALEKVVEEAAQGLSSLKSAPPPAPAVKSAPPPAPPASNAASAPDVNAVRARAKMSLMNAERNGQLETIMSSKKTAAKQATTTQAERSGKLEKVTEEKEGESGKVLPLAAPIYPQAIGIEGGLLSAAALTMPALLF